MFYTCAKRIKSLNLYPETGDLSKQGLPFFKCIIMRKSKLDLKGKKFGRWTVIEEVENKCKSSRAICWKCICECGVEGIVQGTVLNNGKSSSCGCFTLEVNKGRAIHGGARKSGKTPEYNSWQHMKDRCLNINFKQFPDYGGRGIIVCPQWLGKNGFATFLSDMGERPTKKHSLDRFPDTNGNYTPENCRWATKKEQQSNRRCSKFLTYKGETQIITEWARRLSVDGSGIRRRLEKGESFESVVEYYKNKKSAA